MVHDRRRPGRAARAILIVALTAGLWASCGRSKPPQNTMCMGSATVHPQRVEDLATRLRRHVEALADRSGRSWRQPETLSAVARNIEDFWTKLGYRVERQPIPGMGRDYVNVIAFQDDRGWEGRPTVLAAHYDAVEGTPGADDNASGVSVLLEVSRLIAERQPETRRVVFVAFTLEEPPFFQTPRQGSWVLVSRLRKQRVELQGALVLEMVGYYRQGSGSQGYPFPLGFLGYPEQGNFCGLVANRNSRALLPDLARSIEGAGLPVETLAVPGKGRILEPVRFSDHATFWDLGYRAVMITDTAFYRNPHYHGPDDTPDTLDYESTARLVIGLGDYFTR